MDLFKQAIGHLASCKDVSHFLSQAQERDLSSWERARLRWHLAVCGMCRNFERQLRFLHEAMRRYRE